MAMLTDTGPLVALILEFDPHKEKVERVYARLREPLITSSACIAETLHLLGRSGGWPAQRALLALLRGAALLVYGEADGAAVRAAMFMERYHDLPCDYADATLLVSAEDTGLRQIFTIDPHFNAYRLTNGDALEILR